jgi:hypothetical protein
MKTLARWERVAVITMVLLAWGLRWIMLMETPPGWRDDDLIELYTFSARILEEGPVLYFDGASGHEPLYHTLRAPLIAAAGINQASARWPSATAGTLAVLLTWAMGRSLRRRRLRRRRLAALTAGTLVALSFWGLMYSRVAIRHIGLLPWALVAMYWAWRLLRSEQLSRRATAGAVIGIAVGTGGALLTYYAGRLMPVLLLAAFPLLAPRRGRWRPYLLALILGIALALPMFWTAAHLPGADARVSELALPIHALLAGDPQPLLQTAWTTLGMAHAQGDPEWLYNTAGRPVLGAAGAVLFYIALVAAMVRWRDPAGRYLLLWLAAGISPALISLPPSSYGHTILALPAVYLILANLVSIVGGDCVGSAGTPSPARGLCAAALAGVLVVGVGLRDLPDYFVDWPAHGMVRFLYRADYRATAGYLDTHPTPGSPEAVAIGSMLFGPWDKVALSTDSQQLAHARWIHPERALVYVGGTGTDLYLTEVLARESTGWATPLQAVLAASDALPAPDRMHGYRIEPLTPPASAIRHSSQGNPLTSTPLSGALALDAVSTWDSSGDSQSLWIATWWTVTGPLPLPEEKLIPNPPPPGVYNGPRLKVFAHLGTSDEVLSIDDGLWVDPYSLAPGDVVLQFHHFTLPATAPANLLLRLGLYDPASGARWTTETGADHLEIALDR